MKTAARWQYQLKGRTTCASIRAIQSDALNFALAILAKAGRFGPGFDGIFDLVEELESQGIADPHPSPTTPHPSC